MKFQFKWLVAIVLISLIGFGLSNNATAAELTTFTKYTNSLQKEWKITFSKDVNPDSVKVNETIYLQDATNKNVPLDSTKTVINGNTVTVYPQSDYIDGNTYTLHVTEGVTSSTATGNIPLAPPAQLTFTVNTANTEIAAAGTYRDVAEYKGDVIIKAPGVTLENTVIKGNLIISKEVGEGEVYFKNVTVEGETRVLGGGENSVYFDNSALATVIVNKNTGAVRVVVKGGTSVQEVSIESAVTLQEDALTGTGFNNVEVQETMVNDAQKSVKLIGTFETVNVYAADIQLTLPQNATVQDLILAATTVIQGQGIIANVNVGQKASGSQFETMPQSAVLDIGTNISVGNQTIEDSFSNAETTSIESVEATPAFMTVHFTAPMYNLTAEDFVVKVTDVTTNQEVPLINLTYDANKQMFAFTPITYTENISTYKVEVGPSASTTKVKGSTVSTTFDNNLGFSGRITDKYGQGIANATIVVNNTTNPDDSTSYRAATNAAGYYFVPTYIAGDFRGTITAPGYYEGNIIAVVSNQSIATGVNETLMLSAASNEWKIMVTWNGLEADIDSHLANDYFHVYYSKKTYTADGVQYVDLDWDDTEYYGPETTTIRQFQDGRYIFFLHNFSGMNPLDLSKSKIQVYKGNSTQPDYTFTVPENTGDARYWGAFELYVTNNGEKVELKPINILTNNEQILIQPKTALQQLVDDITLPNSNVLIKDSVAYDSALVSAKTVLAQATATLEQYVAAYKTLIDTLQKEEINNSGGYMFISRNIPYENEGVTTNYHINQPVTFKWGIETPEYVYDESNFLPSDMIHLTLKLDRNNLDSEPTAIANQSITFKNLATGESKTLTTDANGTIDFGQMTYDEFLSRPDYEVQTQFSTVGDYSIVFDAKTDRLVYPDDPTWYVGDTIYQGLRITE